MTRFSNKIALVLPTRDRPNLLHRLLTSVVSQEHQPDQIIVVNGGDTRLKTTLNEFSELPITYVESQPPSLTRQKNIGVRSADQSMTLIACLDDDIVLGGGALEAMMEFWETAEADVGGASFNLQVKRPATSWAQSLFFVDNSKFGRVLPSGYNTPITSAQETRLSQWLIGGATVWRRAIFRENSFSEWFVGSGLIEDVFFSYPIGKKHKLYVVADAKVQHLEPKRNVHSSFRVGKVQVINRIYFVKSNPDLSLPKCYWTLFGTLSANLLKGLYTFNRHRVLKSSGNIVGLVQALTGRLPRVEVSTNTAGTSAD